MDHFPKSMENCNFCRKTHAPGMCVFTSAGGEFCGLCGLAHFDGAAICPNMQSKTQIRLMLDALAKSPESHTTVDQLKVMLRSQLVLRSQGKNK